MSAYNKVWQVFERLTPKPHDLPSPDRFYIREGYLRMFDEKKRKMKKRYFFLFNDVLLITKKETRKRFWLRIHITLRSPYCSVESLDSGNRVAYEFKLHCKTRSFLFRAESQTLAESWANDIRDSITGEHEKKMGELEKEKNKLMQSKIQTSASSKSENEESNEEETRSELSSGSVENVTDSVWMNKNQKTEKHTKSKTSKAKEKNGKKTSSKRKGESTRNDLLIDLSAPTVTTSIDLFAPTSNNPFSNTTSNNRNNPFEDTQNNSFNNGSGGYNPFAQSPNGSSQVFAGSNSTNPFL